MEKKYEVDSFVSNVSIHYYYYVTTIFCLKFTQPLLYILLIIFIFILYNKKWSVGEYVEIQLDHYYYNCTNNERIFFLKRRLTWDYITRHQQIKKEKKLFSSRIRSTDNDETSRLTYIERDNVGSSHIIIYACYYIPAGSTKNKC